MSIIQVYSNFLAERKKQISFQTADDFPYNDLPYNMRNGHLCRIAEKPDETEEMAYWILVEVVKHLARQIVPLKVKAPVILDREYQKKIVEGIEMSVFECEEGYVADTILIFDSKEGQNLQK